MHLLRKALGKNGDSQPRIESAGWQGFWRKRLEHILAGTPAGKDTVAAIYLRLGDKEQALNWLEKSFEEHGNGPLLIKTHPEFDSLRSEPRFTELLRRAGHMQ